MSSPTQVKVRCPACAGEVGKRPAPFDASEPPRPRQEFGGTGAAHSQTPRWGTRSVSGQPGWRCEDFPALRLEYASTSNCHEHYGVAGFAPGSTTTGSARH